MTNAEELWFDVTYVDESGEVCQKFMTSAELDAFSIDSGDYILFAENVTSKERRHRNA